MKKAEILFWWLSCLWSVLCESFPPALDPPLKQVIVPENENFAVTCVRPSGHPPPQVWWVDPSSRIISGLGRVRIEDTRLIITSAEISDTGVYTCLSESLDGTKENSIRITVSSMPVITGHPQNQSVQEGGKTVLNCQFNGTPYPATSVRWLKDKKILQQDPPFYVISPQNGTLIINRVRTIDNGSYVCEVSTSGFPSVFSNQGILHVKGAYCIDPGALKYGRRQPEFKHMSLLPRGSQLHFSCRPEYVLEGSSKMVCGSQGMWEPPAKPTCRPVVCSEPPIENGRIRTSKVGSYFPGTTVQVVCDEGYRLKDSYVDMLECHLDGVWVGHNGQYTLETPTCVEHTCSAPPQLPNSQARVHGEFGWDGGYRLKSVVTYECEYGFQIEDMRGSRLVCKEGQWRPEYAEVSLSKCVQGGCSRPLPIENGYFAPKWAGIYPFTSIVTYSCDLGYTLAGHKYNFECTPDGTWSPTMRKEYLPVCQRHLSRGCPEPPFISHGSIEKINGTGPTAASNTYPENTVVSYACDAGFRLPDCSTNWIVCRGDRWINSPPTCVELGGCGKPPSVPYAMVTRRDVTTPNNSPPTTNDNSHSPPPRYPLYTKVHYKCLPGFQLLGTPDLICAPGGCWIPNTPQCVLLKNPYEDWVAHHTPSDLQPLDSSHDSISDSSISDTSSWSDTHLITISVGTASSIIGALILVQLLVLCQRRKWTCLFRRGGRHHRHHRTRRSTSGNGAGSASTWSNSSSAASSPCSRLPLPAHHFHHLHAAADPDRVALIAFADGVQVVLPSYEEAIRQTGIGPPPFEDTSGMNAQRSGGRCWGRAITLPSLPPSGRRSLRNGAQILGTPESSENAGPRRQSSSGTGDSNMGSTDTVATSEVSTTVTLDTLSSNASNASSQPLSCRGICSSLASFDTCSALNVEGVPLLEDVDMENNEAELSEVRNEQEIIDDDVDEVQPVQQQQNNHDISTTAPSQIGHHHHPHRITPVQDNNSSIENCQEQSNSDIPPITG